MRITALLTAFITLLTTIGSVRKTLKTSKSVHFSFTSEHFVAVLTDFATALAD